MANTPTRTFTVTFLKGIRGTDGVLIDGTPQIVFLGRSNAGKSSTINCLLGRPVARTSSMPGKTTEINIYDVREGEDHIRVLDLPGYGWSQAKIKHREKLRKLVLWYLTESGAKPRLVILIVDATIPPSEFDREASQLCREMAHPLLILANKLDRLNQKERHASLALLATTFPQIPIVPFSAKTGEGREETLARIFG